MKNIIILLSAYILLTSCSVQMPMQPSVKIVDIENTKLNTTFSKEIGETLIEQGLKCESEAILVENVPQTKTYKDLKYKNGDIVPITVIYRGYKLYSDDKNRIASKGIAVSIKYGYAFPYKFTSVGDFQIIMDKQQIKYKNTEYEVGCDKSFKRQFIFNGKVGNSLKFTYREFLNDFARPAFNQDLQYDLTESNVIGFRGLRIEVLKANNTTIEYKVLNLFNP